MTDFQRRQARLPVDRGGLGVASSSLLDGAPYLASCVQSRALQDRILAPVFRGLPHPHFDTTLADFARLFSPTDPTAPSTHLAHQKPLSKLAKLVVDKEWSALEALLRELEPGLAPAEAQKHMRHRIARFHCVSTPAASHWLLQLPKPPREASPIEYRIALKLRFGMPLFPPVSRCMAVLVKDRQTACNAAMDPLGIHALHCRVGEKGALSRHQHVAQAFMEVFKMAGLPCAQDPQNMQVPDDDGVALRPADVLITQGARTICCDVTVASPFVANRGWRGAVFDETAAAEEAYRGKILKNEAPCGRMGLGFWALAFDCFGNPAEGTEKHMADMVKRVGTHLGVRGSVASGIVRRRISWAVTMGVVQQIRNRKSMEMLI